MKDGAQVAISLLFFHFHHFPAIFRVSLYLETEGHKGEFKFRQCNDDVDIKYDSAKPRLALDIHWDMSLHKMTYPGCLGKSQK